MLNQYCYRILIRPWIHVSERHVLTKKEMYIHAFKLSSMYTRRAVLSSISLHCGSPCARYCICSYFSMDDVLNYYYRLRSTSESLVPSG